MSFNGRTALVTGSTGFIGGHLVNRLQSLGWKTVALVRNSKEVSGDFETYDVAEDREGETLQTILNKVQPDTVFHLASHYLADHKSSDVNSLIESNLLLGTRLLQAIADRQKDLRAAPMINFISAGTGWQRMSADEPSPVNLYAATKEAFGSIARYFASAHGIRIVELRLFDTYGPRDQRKKVIRLLLEAASSNNHLEIQFSPGDQMLNFAHVSDVSNAFIAAAEWLRDQSPSTFQIFQADSDQTLSLKSLVAEVERVTGKTINVKWGSRPYRFREVMVPDTTHQRVPGWKPKISIHEGLLEAFKSLNT